MKLLQSSSVFLWRWESRKGGVARLSTSGVVAKGQKTEIDGLQLYWEKFGNGPHVVLCLPGLLGSISTNFHPVCKKMDSEQYTMIAWDPPGYGKSRPPDRDVFMKDEFPLARDARLAAELMAALSYTKYSCLGWSNGGITGALIAATFPENVSKVVMCNSPLNYNNRFKKIMEVMIDLDNWQPSQRTPLLRVYERAYAVQMLTDWKKWNDEQMASRSFYKYCLQHMNQIKAPTLYIKSMEDFVVPINHAEGYQHIITDFTLHKVPIGGHDHLEFLDEFVAATQAFLTPS